MSCSSYDTLQHKQMTSGLLFVRDREKVALEVKQKTDDYLNTGLRYTKFLQMTGKARGKWKDRE